MVGRALTFTTGVPAAAPSVVYEWTIGVTDATIDEGQALNYFIDLDRNGLEPLPTSFSVRFPAPLVGAVNPNEANASSFVLNQSNYLKAVSTAFNAANPSNPSQFIEAIGVFTFIMPAIWNGHLDFPRLTISNPANQGDKITGLELISVSPGVILEADEPVGTSYVSVVIADAESVSPVPVLVTAPALNQTVPSVGVPISCSTGAWTNNPSSYAYQWQKGTTNIALEISSSYVPVAGDVGSTLRCSVVAHNAGGDSTAAFSASSSAVIAAPVPVISTVPVINNTSPAVGTAVSCSTGTWTNNPTGFFYQWQKGTTNIAGATSASYTPVTGDIGSTLRCSVVATNANGSSVASFSASTAAVISTPPVVVNPPVLTAAPILNQTTPVQSIPISCSTGTWTNSPTSFAYQWQKATTNISGATSPSYTPVAGDVGSTLRCSVVATNAAGSSAAAFSASSAATAASGGTGVPVVSVAPAINNLSPAVGVQLTCSTGTWSQNPTSFAYQWQKATTDIAGATTANYTPVTGDVGTTLRCGVISTNANGASAISRSNSTAAVVATPAAGDLVELVFGSLPKTVGPALLIGAAEDTLVEYVTGKDIAGSPVVLDELVFETGGSVGGIFKIGAFVGGSGHPIQVAAVTPDFEGPLVNTNPPYGGGVSYYSITVRGTAGASAVTGKLKVRPRFPKVVATGGATPLVATDNATALAALGGTHNNQKITFDFNGVAQRSNSQPNMFGTNTTVLGNPGFIGIRGSGPNMRLANGLIVNLACAAGADLAGGNRESRDTCNIGNCDHTIVRNCSFMWSIDELCSLAAPSPSKQARYVEIVYCFFSNPLLTAGQSQGEPIHNFGMLMNRNNMGVVIHFCVFFNCHARHPDINGPCKGIHSFNNLYLNYGLGCLTCNGIGGPSGSYISEGNLFHYRSPAGRNWALGIYDKFGADNYWYVPLPGDGPYVNHFITFANGVWGFANDPVDWRIHTNVQGAPTTDKVVFCNFRPFEQVDDYGIMPTSTPAERQALWNHVMDNVGCRTLVDPDDPLSPGIPGDINAQYETYDTLKKLRATGPAGLAEAGGFTTTWPGDGTSYNLALDTVKDKFRTPLPPHAP